MNCNNKKISDFLIKILTKNVKFGRFLIGILNLKFKARNREYLTPYIDAKNNNVDITTLPKVEGIFRKIQLGNLALLKEFDYVCRSNNIEYWLDYGSLLGAVRHKGFIPWDEDIDVGMERQDYEKFIETFNKHSRNKDMYVKLIQNKHTPCMRYLKIYHSKLPFVWLDIFPFDYYHSALTDETLNSLNKNIRDIRIRANSDKSLLKYSSSELREFIKTSTENIFGENQDVDKSNKTALVRGIDLPSADEVWAYKYEDLFPLIELEFEGCKFKAFKNCETFLKDLYGDYMGYPPNMDFIHSQRVIISPKEEALIDDLLTE